MSVKQYYVWNVVNPPNPAKYFKVNSPQEGKVKIDRLAARQLKNSQIDSNAFGLIVAEGNNVPHPNNDDNGEYWYDWHNVEGDDIDRASETGVFEED